MAEDTRAARVTTLRSVAEQRKHDALERAEKAIRKLLLNGDRLTFASVAREARLSVAYLYKYPELQNRLNHLRRQQDERGDFKVKPPPASERSQQVVIQHLRARIQELETERDAQRKHIAALSGQLYDLSGAKDLLERLRDENARLSKQVTELEHRRTIGNDISPPPSPTGFLERIKDELYKLDIRITDALSRKILSFPESRVTSAIAVVREAAASGKLRSSIRLFIKALDEGWEPAEHAASVEAKRESHEFSRWFDAARKRGLVMASRGTDRGIMVLTADKKWFPYQDLCKRAGWSIQDIESTQMQLTESRRA